MKNIHVLPKNVLNQLGIDHYGKTPTQIKIAEFLININIYITSGEEIKEGDWILVPSTNGTDYFDWSGCIPKKAESNYAPNKFVWKIILTTDTDLIKDGVQAIPDEFLEWFVKNPSCEFVEVKKGFADGSAYGYDFLSYKIIIPQEEPKQGTMSEAIKQVINNQLKQETTLEEAAERYIEEYDVEHYISIEDFIIGAKWQAERMYSEEDMNNYAEYCSNHILKSQIGNPYLSAKEWFEQFKKK
jgi:hypothetical protein